MQMPVLLFVIMHINTVFYCLLALLSFIHKKWKIVIIILFSIVFAHKILPHKLTTIILLYIITYFPKKYHISTFNYNRALYKIS